MWTAVIALAGAAAAVAAAGGVWLASARRSRRRERRLQEALSQVAAPLERISRELADIYERFEQERRLEQTFSHLVATADLSEVLRWTAETAANLSGAIASVVQVAGANDGEPTVAAHGVQMVEGLTRLVVWPPHGPRTVSFTFEYGPTADVPVRFSSGLAVPLDPEAGQAFIAVFSVNDPPDERAVAALEALAAVAWPVIARLRRAARQNAGSADSLTGLGARRVFHDTLAREVAHAHVSEQPLALIVFDVDDFRAVNSRHGLSTADTVLAEIGHRVGRAVEAGAGTSCRIGTDEFGVILPNATTVDAEGIFAGVQASLRRTPPEQVSGLAVSAGVAELRGDDDSIGVFERAHHALRDAKQAGKGTAIVATAVNVSGS